MRVNEIRAADIWHAHAPLNYVFSLRNYKLSFPSGLIENIQLDGVIYRKSRAYIRRPGLIKQLFVDLTHLRGTSLRVPLHQLA